MENIICMLSEIQPTFEISVDHLFIVFITIVLVFGRMYYDIIYLKRDSIKKDKDIQKLSESTVDKEEFKKLETQLSILSDSVKQLNASMSGIDAKLEMILKYDLNFKK
jgi:hypothetical protein